MKISNFNYYLPNKLIAQVPIKPRDACKLMLLKRETSEIEHYKFNEIDNLLFKNDVLVVNNSKVFPARLVGKKSTGGRIELILLRQIKDRVWLASFGGNPKIGSELIFGELRASVRKIKIDLVEIEFENDNYWELIEKIGQTPLPPYIKSSKNFKKEYQTVYAKERGSTAAPTAGLHFTQELIKNLKSKGVKFIEITLHVGLGTFGPVYENELESHKMHAEYYEIDKKTADKLNKFKNDGRRIIAVGTTSARALESNYKNKFENFRGETEIFIYPPYKFRAIDGLITNFHLPKTTLLSLVSAFVSEPNTNNKFINFKKSLLGKAYAEAINNNYQFYSFGDGMLII